MDVPRAGTLAWLEGAGGVVSSSAKAAVEATAATIRAANARGSLERSFGRIWKLMTPSWEQTSSTVQWCALPAQRDRRGLYSRAYIRAKLETPICCLSSHFGGQFR